MKPINYSFYMSLVREHLKSRKTIAATGIGAISGASFGAGIFFILTWGDICNKKSATFIAAAGTIGGGVGFTGYTLFKASGAVVKKIAPNIFKR